jgi:hypothetical protein
MDAISKVRDISKATQMLQNKAKPRTNQLRPVKSDPEKSGISARPLKHSKIIPSPRTLQGGHTPSGPSTADKEGQSVTHQSNTIVACD